MVSSFLLSDHLLFFTSKWRKNSVSVKEMSINTSFVHRLYMYMYCIHSNSRSCTYKRQWRHQGGHGAFDPPVGGSAPPPLHLEKKIAKISHFWHFFLFLPLRIAFCPLDAPHKKISGAATELSAHPLKDLSQFQRKPAHAPQKELPKRKL